MATVTRTHYDYVDDEVLKVERTALRMAFMGECIPDYYMFKDLETDLGGAYSTKQMDVIEFDFRRAVQEYNKPRGLGRRRRW